MKLFSFSIYVVIVVAFLSLLLSVLYYFGVFYIPYKVIIFSQTLTIFFLFLLLFVILRYSLHTALMDGEKRFQKSIRSTVDEYRNIIFLLEEKNEYLLERWSSTNKNRKERARDIDLAKRIQEGLLPRRFPAVRGTQFASYYNPIEEIGGDFYDIISVEPNKTVIFIADVSGHGIASALITAMLKSSLRSHAHHHHGVEALMSNINEDLSSYVQTSHYVTAILAVYDSDSRLLKYVNASHPPPAIYSKRAFLMPASKNPIIGKFKDAVYKSEEILLSPRDKVLFYTDGVIEASRDKRKRDSYTEKRLIESLNRSGDKDVYHLVNDMQGDLMRFMLPIHPDDDYTFLAFSVEELVFRL